MRYICPSGYSPDPLDPGVGALAVWDDDTLTYTDLLTGVSRPYTDAETLAARELMDAHTLATGLDDLLARARAALEANATFLALAAPTNAQVLTQVRRITREANALIRYAVRDLGDGTSWRGWR